MSGQSSIAISRARRLFSGSSLPSTANVGDVFLKSGSSAGFYYALTANTWTGPLPTSDVAAVWGSITGTLSNQTDLQSALNAKLTNTATAIGSAINAATAKTTPVDADVIALSDSAASNVLKKLSWANIKATLKTYFDTLYPSGSGTSTGSNSGDQDLSGYALTANVPVVLSAYKNDNETRTANTTLALDSQLFVTILVAGIYNFTLIVPNVSADAVGGIKAGMGGSITITTLIAEVEYFNNVSQTLAKCGRISEVSTLSVVGGVDYCLRITGTIDVSDTNKTFGLSWAQQAASGNTLLAGLGSLVVTKVG